MSSSISKLIIEHSYTVSSDYSLKTCCDTNPMEKSLVDAEGNTLKGISGVLETYCHSNPKSVVENEMHKILLDFEKQTDHLMSARQPELMIVQKKKKRTCRIVDFTVPADLNVKLKQSKRKVPGPCLRTKKLRNMKVTLMPIGGGALGTIAR